MVRQQKWATFPQFAVYMSNGRGSFCAHESWIRLLRDTTRSPSEAFTVSLVFAYLQCESFNQQRHIPKLLKQINFTSVDGTSITHGEMNSNSQFYVCFKWKPRCSERCSN